MARALGVRLERCSLLLAGRPVLDEVSLDVAPGARLLLVGPNGAGKTQLIKLLGGLRWPTALGPESRRYRDARGRPVDLLDARERIAYVGAESQDKYVRYGWNHTIAETVATGLYRTDIPLDEPSPAARKRVQSLLRRFALGDVGDARMLEVSYGQRRLALVARAIASQPGLLLLDEVFNGLDDRHRQRLLAALRQSLRRGGTVVSTAHRPEDVLPGATAAAWVEEGRVVGLAPRRALAWLRRTATGRPVVRHVAPARPRARGSRIELRNVTVYRDERPALLGVDWVLREGEHWAVTGRNGSGKSTLLGTLYGIHAVAAGGEIVRRGCPRGTPLDEIRRHVAWVSPELQAGYDADSTLEELVVSGLRSSVGLDHPPTRGERTRARRELRTLGLLPLAGRRPREVSYGQLRLALLARAFVRQPRLLVLDEPFTGLDPAFRRTLRHALSRLARRGTQLVIAVHHLDDLPPEVNRRLRLRHGAVVR